MNYYFFNSTVIIKILLWTTLGFSIGLSYRQALLYFTKDTSKNVSKNINTTDRIQRAVIATIFFISGLLLHNNPIFLIISGFTLFEVAGSWCIINSMLGKNSCNLE